MHVDPSIFKETTSNKKTIEHQVLMSSPQFGTPQLVTFLWVRPGPSLPRRAREPRDHGPDKRWTAKRFSTAQALFGFHHEFSGRCPFWWMDIDFWFNFSVWSSELVQRHPGCRIKSPARVERKSPWAFLWQVQPSWISVSSSRRRGICILTDWIYNLKSMDYSKGAFPIPNRWTNSLKKNDRKLTKHILEMVNRKLRSNKKERTRWKTKLYRFNSTLSLGYFLSQSI